MTVNYIRELEAFMDYASINRLSGSERLLWQALFHLFNERRWPDGMQPVRREELRKHTGLSDDTVARARRSLVRRGLISYESAGGCACGMYSISFLSTEFVPQNAAQKSYPQAGNYQQTEIAPQNAAQAEEIAPQNASQKNICAAKCVTKSEFAPQNAALDYTPYIENNNINKGINDNKTEDDDDIPLNRDARAREETRTKIGERFYAAIGRRALSGEVEMLAEEADYCGADDELMAELIGRAGKYGARSPAAYVAKCLKDCADQQIRHLDELIQQENAESLTRSANPDVYERGCGLLKKLRAERELRRRLEVVPG